MAGNLQISIDGPVAAGKSTAAERVADKLGILYVDTGAMYRAVAYYAKDKGVDWHDEGKICGLIGKVEIKLDKPVGELRDGRKVSVYVNGKDVSWKVRADEFGEGASVIGQYLPIREKLVSWQRDMARNCSVIMEGRDIGTRVLPGADLKIYMDARIDERVRRKLEQLDKVGVETSEDMVRQDVMTRDRREMNREIDPLRPAEGAWIFDTTDLSVTQVVDRIVRRVAKL